MKWAAENFRFSLATAIAKRELIAPSLPPPHAGQFQQMRDAAVCGGAKNLAVARRAQRGRRQEVRPLMVEYLGHELRQRLRGAVEPGGQIAHEQAMRAAQDAFQEIAELPARVDL